MDDGQSEIIPGQKSASRKRSAVEWRPTPEFPEAGFWTATPSRAGLQLFRSGKKFDGRAELTTFEQRRRDTLAWLDSLPVSAGGRTGRHEELGVLTFNQLLNEFAFHDLRHTRQVIELYRSHAFYPNMGVFQGYYKINP